MGGHTQQTYFWLQVPKEDLRRAITFSITTWTAMPEALRLLIEKYYPPTSISNYAKFIELQALLAQALGNQIFGDIERDRAENIFEKLTHWLRKQWDVLFQRQFDLELGLLLLASHFPIVYQLLDYLAYPKTTSAPSSHFEAKVRSMLQQTLQGRKLPTNYSRINLWLVNIVAAAVLENFKQKPAISLSDTRLIDLQILGDHGSLRGFSLLTSVFITLIKQATSADQLKKRYQQYEALFPAELQNTFQAPVEHEVFRIRLVYFKKVMEITSHQLNTVFHSKLQYVTLQDSDAQEILLHFKKHITPLILALKQMIKMLYTERTSEEYFIPVPIYKKLQENAAKYFSLPKETFQGTPEPEELTTLFSWEITTVLKMFPKNIQRILHKTATDLPNLLAQEEPLQNLLT
jgi:hypothetical protein